MPQDNTIDGTLSLLFSDGYDFIRKRCARLQTDIFQTRLLLEKTICVQGEAWARHFYDSARFKRAGAVPSRIKKTLFGEGGVQGMDGEGHEHRKSMFMSLMAPERIQELLRLSSGEWQRFARRWQNQEEVVLYDEVAELLCRAVCAWTGAPLGEEEAKTRAAEMVAMVQAIGAIGPRHWRGRWARNSAEEWIMDLITEIRSGQRNVPEDSVAHLFIFHRDLEGNLLDAHTAAVEWLNILRPTVAITRFITFAAVALHRHPEYLGDLQESDKFVEMFVQETRRYFPFAPFVGAIVRRTFEQDGYHFPQGRLVLLDIYGTLRDERIWDQPEQFRPQRFREWQGNPYNLIPQGGGDYETGHRCAGEWITIEVMKQAVAFLSRELRYDVPPQDLGISLTRIPAIPQSRFIMRNVRAVAHDG